MLLPVLKEMLLLKKQEPLPIEGIWDNCLNIVWFMMVLSLVLQVQWACFLDIRTAARSRNIGVYRGYPSLKHRTRLSQQCYLSQYNRSSPLCGSHLLSVPGNRVCWQRFTASGQTRESSEHHHNNNGMSSSSSPLIYNHALPV